MLSPSDRASYNVISAWSALIHSTTIINHSNFSAFHLLIHGSSDISTAVILLPNISTEDFQRTVNFDVWFLRAWFSGTIELPSGKVETLFVWSLGQSDLHCCRNGVAWFAAQIDLALRRLDDFLPISFCFYNKVKLNNLIVGVLSSHCFRCRFHFADRRTESKICCLE